MKKRNLNKLVLLAVLMGGVTCSNSVLADNITPSDRNNNTVIVTSSGYTINGGAEVGGTSWENVYGAYYNSHQAVQNNTITIQGGQISGDVYGGYHYGSAVSNPNAQNNTVNIEGGTFNGTGSIYGGCSDNGNAGDSTAGIIMNGNTVTISGGTGTLESVTGGKGKTNGDRNKVTIKGGSYTIKNIVGGEVTMTGGSLQQHSSDNVVTISDSATIVGDTTAGLTIYGGKSSGQIVVSNTVTISGGSVTKVANVYGGYSSSAEVGYSGNTMYVNKVNVEGTGTFTGIGTGSIYGGRSDGSAVSCAEITLNNNTITGFKSFYGGYANKASYKNTITITAISNDAVEGDSNGISVAGGYGGGNANMNKVNLAAGTYSKIVVGGYSTGTGTASNNEVNITGGTYTDKIYGGYSTSSTATGNKVTIKATNTLNISGADIYGSNITPTALVTNNDANILDLTGMTTDVSAKSVANFNVIKLVTKLSLTANSDLTYTTIDASGINTVTDGLVLMEITGGTFTTSNAVVKLKAGLNGYVEDAATHGIYAQEYKGDFSDNTKVKVKREDGINIAGVYYDGTGKGYNKDSLTAGNVSSGYLTISIDVTATGKQYYGAYAEDTVTAAGGTLNMVSGGKATDVYGGYSVSGVAGDVNKGNKVEISGTATGTGKVYGGKGSTTANYNIVNVNSDNTGFVTYYGGYGATGAGNNIINLNSTNMGTIAGDGSLSVVGGYVENNGNAVGNRVNITSGTYSKVVAGGYVKGTTSGNAYGNKVVITSGTYTSDVYGGYSYAGDAGTDSTNKGNAVVINGGTFNSAVYGGYAKTNKANYNTVETNGGSFQRILGGYSEGSGSTTGNIITVNGGSVSAGIYGGYSENGNATYNTVIFNGGTIENNVKIYGGYSGGAGSVTGNTVVLGSNVNWNGTGIKIYGGSDDTTITDNTMRILRNNLSSTGSHSFALADNFDTYIFDLTNVQADDVLLDNTTAISITEITNITIENAERSQLKKDDAIVLMNLTSGGTDLTGKIQPSSDYSITIDGTNKMILTALKDLAGGDESTQKSPVEGIAAATATVNSSSDLACGAGMSNLLTSTANITGTESFGAANFGNAKYKSGSHVDARGYGLMFGVGKKVFNKAGDKTTGGIFFEYGNSNFDTYNGNVTGEGKSIYKGGGYMMRFDSTGGNYYEGMIHAGKVRTNWSKDNSLTNESYDINPTYFGGALTYGHKFMVAKERQLAVYGSYIYSRTCGADATIGTKEYSFSATNSHRTKLGVRYSASDLMDTRKFRPYVGLAWEHEYDGESRATIKGMGEAPAPTMKGHSGILEIGCNQEVGKWTLGIGTELFTGKRKGWNGTLQATYNF